MRGLENLSRFSNYLRGVTMEIKTINSSRLNWEIFPQTDHECRVIYCADGDGFVSIEEYVYPDGEVWYSLMDQGERSEEHTSELQSH